ncbi:MAG: multiprotein bridging factor aMBF1 [Candidatus Helarchaeota archaeon]
MSRSEVCDVCGQEIFGKPQFCLIEGAKLKVCYKCSKFGTKIKEPPKRQYKSRSSKSSSRRIGRNKHIEELELVEDFNKIIKREREKRGWTQHELGQKINVRESLIRKIEAGREPTDDLRKKLEELLEINLLTVVDIGESLKYKTAPKPSGDLTLGDVVRIKRKKNKKE